LFVTWDGPQVSYVESLFIPIFRGLAEHGIGTDILQFRWGTKAQEEEVRSACAAADIGYRAVTVRQGLRGLAPFMTAVLGAGQVRRCVRDFGSDVIMPRSILPAIPVLRAGGASLRPILLDADGLASDERVEFAGLSPKSLTYRLLRDVEAQAVREAGAVIVRSESAKGVLVSRAGPPVTEDRFVTVTNGRDERLFHPSSQAEREAVRAELGIRPDAPLLVYAGSVGPQYRFDQLAGLAEAMLDRRPDSRLLVLTGSPDAARAALGGSDRLGGATTIMRAPPDEVPRYLAAADIGAAFRTATFSTRAVAPVKLSECLLCGVPVVGTSSIGDTAAAVEAGVFFPDNGGVEAAAQWAVTKVLPQRESFRERARQVGLDRFSLARSVADYRAAIALLRSRGADSRFGPVQAKA
jgi:glycosyltransferase involved in cell wall biosynthesis